VSPQPPSDDHETGIARREGTASRQGAGGIAPPVASEQERAPMQWAGEDNVGFTSGEPWLPLAPDYRDLNVVQQRNDPRSLLMLYKELIRLRHAMPMLASGEIRMEPCDEPLIVYSCISGDQHIVVALNLDSTEQACRLFQGRRAALLMSTWLDRRDELVHADVSLRGHEGLMLRLA
jgi:alpha-glucosidase